MRLFRFAAVLACAWVAPLFAQPPAAPVVIDTFDSVSQWTAIPADGVEITVHSDSGARGRAMRLDFDFHGHGGYAVVRRAVNLALPANYEFSFAIRGDAPVNTLEFKLADSTGENVWWSNTPDLVFPPEWTLVTRKKRHISFAWGPTTDRELRRVFAIEFAITAGSGGKGSVWIDDLTLTPLDPPTSYTLTPRITAGSRAAGHGIELAMDATPATAWRSASRPAGAPAVDTIGIDFLTRREFGGLIIDWEPGRRAAEYEVLGSVDEIAWTRLYGVARGSSSPAFTRDYLRMPETDARHVRLVLTRPEGRSGFGISEIAVQPLEWAATKNDLYFAIAKDAPRGSYPKYLSNEQSYWTVIGADRDSAEALINEEGMIEVGRGELSIEPFLYVDGKLVTWSDARITVPVVQLDRDRLLPPVVWHVGPETTRYHSQVAELQLAIQAFAVGPPDSAVLYARYSITNNRRTRRHVTLYLALRPLQVNPPWQFLNREGGVARLDTIELQGAGRGSFQRLFGSSAARATGNKFLYSMTPAKGFGAVSFHEGNVVDWLRTGTLPPASSIVDPAGSASAAFAYDFDIAAYASSNVDVAVPLSGGILGPRADGGSRIVALMEQARAAWREKIDRVRVELPPHAFRHVRTLRANLGYILINRDGPAIQPGSRSYSRSWIRDGSLTSTALLRMGHAPAVKEFIEWYAPYQYKNGKIPCCVDEQGATPVPENDSHGQFIYLVAEYYRHTGDAALLRRMWPHVAKAVSYMDSLRHSRMTEEYRSGDKRAFYGLMPESISHEGYSAKPMHSYWDDFFALRGFTDAAFVAAVLRRPESADFARIRDAFQEDFYASIRFVTNKHAIDFIPGSAELADFDATSTTVAVSPGGEAHRLPADLLAGTFDRYFREARERATGAKPWEAYTPYELRTVGTFVQLGQKARAHELLSFFFLHQRPLGWYMWAEVVFNDRGKPSFIGDMPHTWVGSDYIRSFLDMFAFERESDSSLVVGAGVKEDWVREQPGVRVAGLSTHYGPITYDMLADSGGVTVNLSTGLRIPPGGIVVQSPLDQPFVSATLNGVSNPGPGSEVIVRALPATVLFRYAN
ncbi:discoidin domain-containing protein [soil metagenome]